MEGIEHCHDIPDMQGQHIRRRIVRFVTGSMTACIYQDELVVSAQRVNIPGHLPGLQALRKPMLEDKWWPFAFDVVMDTDTLMGDIWHRLRSSTDGVGMLPRAGTLPNTHAHWLHDAAPAAGALFVVAIGKLMAAHQEMKRQEEIAGEASGPRPIGAKEEEEPAPPGYRWVHSLWRTLPDGTRDYAAYYGKTAFRFLAPLSSKLRAPKR